MHCQICSEQNDPDAAFCVKCGRPLEGGQPAPSGNRSKIVRAVLPLVAALLLLGAAGYYKFFLPVGVAAVVNGEEIRLSELNDEVKRVRNVQERLDPGASFNGKAGSEVLDRLRYEVLTSLIQERILLQEARKAGFTASDEEVAAALAGMRTSTGMDEPRFRRYVEDQYGSYDAFTRFVARRLVISRFITRKVAGGSTDPRAIQTATATWIRDASSRAAVRVSLAEQWSGAGCGCCAGNGPGARAPGAGGAVVRPVADQRPAASGAATASEREQTAAAAGLRYWRAQHAGDDAVTARTKDFGCHLQVDIVKDGTVVKSLRYQNGRISE